MFVNRTKAWARRVACMAVYLSAPILLVACLSSRSVPTSLPPIGEESDIELKQEEPVEAATVTYTAAEADTATPTKTNAPTHTKTAKPTRTKRLTATPTILMSPTPITSPTLTLAPVALEIDHCDVAELQPGQRVSMNVYLHLSIGRYDLSEKKYPVTLMAHSEDWKSLSTVTGVGWFTNGRDPNQMHFDEDGIAVIKDSIGRSISWGKEGGRVIYDTRKPYHVEGSFIEKANEVYCHFTIDRIDTID